MNKITIVVGFDQKEAIAYHTFCQSVIDKSTIPIQFIPLAMQNLYFYDEIHNDGSNKFIYSRFLTPYLCEFEGFAIYADGDMICRSDISELKNLFDPTMAIQVVKHDYKTKQSIKYLENKNVDYPRKNWSSLIIFNCQHPSNKVLTPEFVKNHSGSYLHRFSWLKDQEIGELPIQWNWLAIEYEKNPLAKLIHYTLGTPCFKNFNNTDLSELWWDSYKRTQFGLDL